MKSDNSDEPLHPTTSVAQRKRRHFVRLVVVMSLCAIAFIVFVSRSVIAQPYEGLVAALCAVACGMLLVRRFIRLLAEEDKLQEEQLMHARAEITDFWAMLFNPSFPDRLFHTVCGAWCAGAFLVVSVSAWYLLKKIHLEFARASLKVGLTVALVSSLLQGFSGDRSAKDVAINQPAKLAAFEGLYDTCSNAPLTVIGFVDEKDERTVGLKIPSMLSFLAHGNFHAPVTGLKAFKHEDRPPVTACFLFFHGMVGIGFALIGIAALGFLYFRHGSLPERRWLLWILVFSVIGPQIANQLGWFAAEVGRQPWIVYGLMRTPEGLSAVVQANEVLTSLILFTFIYFMLFAVFIYLLNDKIHHGPDDADLIPSGKLALPEPLVHKLK